jgi:DNA-binding NarL/FixJ family response regulator
MYLYADRPRDAHEHVSRAFELLPGVNPENRAWLHILRALARSGFGDVTEATKDMRSALEFAGSGGAAIRAEVTAATIAVLAASDAPLLAAKAWGALTGGGLEGGVIAPDLALAKRRLTKAQAATDPVSFAIAVKEGEAAGVSAVLDLVSAQLDRMTSVDEKSGHRLAHGTLTAREVEVLGLIGAGMSDGEIAAALFISPKTASVHVSNVKGKLGLNTRLEVALWAREKGLASQCQGPAAPIGP